MQSMEPFQERCLDFSANIIEVIYQIPEHRRSVARLRQLEKSATSIGANIAESQSAQSRLDFISKFEIALKEARETNY